MVTGTSLVLRGGQASKKKSKAEKRFAAWERYIQDESLERNWQRFLHDLGLGDFESKTQCKKACFVFSKREGPCFSSFFGGENYH